jgi:hypothetical protein
VLGQDEPADPDHFNKALSATVTTSISRDRVSDHTLRGLRAQRSSIVEPKQNKVANISCKQSKYRTTASPVLSDLNPESYLII